MDENRKNVEFMKKNIEVGEKKIKLLSELSNQLNSYFNKGEGTITNDGIGKNNIADQLNLAKTLTILNDLQNMNVIKTNNESKENSNKDNINNKLDNNSENTDLTCDCPDETKCCEKVKLIGKKRELNFNEIMDADMKSKKKMKFDNISFSEKLTQKSTSLNSLSNNIIVQNNLKHNTHPPNQSPANVYLPLYYPHIRYLLLPGWYHQNAD
jgi:hypothetical protein